MVLLCKFRVILMVFLGYVCKLIKIFLYYLFRVDWNCYIYVCILKMIYEIVIFRNMIDIYVGLIVD